MIDINLLPEQNIEKQNSAKVKLYCGLIIGIGTLVTVGILGGIFLFQNWQMSQLDALNQRKVTATNTLDSLSQKASDLLTLKKKAKGIVTIGKKTYDFKSAFAYVASLLPPEIQIQKVEIDDSGQVALTLSGLSKQEIADYIDKVANDPNINDSKLAKLVVNEDGTILFNVGGVYGK